MTIVSDDQPAPPARPPRRRAAPGPKLEEIGSDPDPRFTFANERTFLAWNRTALALIGGGLAVAQFLHHASTAARIVIALALIALGAVIAAISYRRWEANERAMRLQRPLPAPRLPGLLAAGIGLIALLVGVLVVIDLTTS